MVNGEWLMVNGENTDVISVVLDSCLRRNDKKEQE